MVRVAPKGKETVINVGTGIEVAIRNEGEYRINWAKIDKDIYIHKEVHAELEAKHKNLNQKYENLAEKATKFNEKYEKLSEEYRNLEIDRNEWEDNFYVATDEKTTLSKLLDSCREKLVISNAIWLFVSLGLLGVIGYLTM